MKYAFYITNHGFGHASRNCPIIKKILCDDSEGEIYIKTDDIRCDFLKRNLFEYSRNIHYYDDCKENGLILKAGTMNPDIPEMKRTIKNDLSNWENYVKREVKFLSEKKITLVISDIVPWALKAARECKIPSMLIGNFNWSEMYKSFFDEDIWKPYSDYYKLADKAIWYEIHAKELHNYCKDYECVSLISRSINEEEVKRIKNSFSKEIVFVSIGASAEIDEKIYVGDLPYQFITTRGLNLKGENVSVLPSDMINTPDYIAASSYVIAKGGWSTVAEILLQRKKCALLFRGNNSEDNNTKLILEKRRQCIGLNGNELMDIEKIINRMKMLEPDSYDIYQDDTEKIYKIITHLVEV